MNLAKTVMGWNKVRLFFGAGLMAFVLMTGLALRTPVAHAASCDKVNIIYCGLSGSSTSAQIDSLRQYYSTSKDSYGNTDIRAVLNWGGWTASMLNGATTTNTKQGTLYRNGDIKVGGVLVAKGAIVSARFNGGTGFTHVEGNVYSRKTTTSFANSSVPVLVHFDANGNANAAIMSDCGNVLRFTVVPKPVVMAECALLDTPTLINKDTHTYSFTAHAKVQNATLTGGSFNFGDGATGKGTVSGTTLNAQHKFMATGTYTITATLTFSANGSTISKTCQTTLRVDIPYYGCVSLSGVILDQKTYSYRFVAKITNGGGATFSNASFDFGDGKTVSNVKSADGKTVSVDHTYGKAGTYSASAVLYFSVNGATVAAPTCRAVVTPTAPPTPECKPGIPVGDVRCNPCPYNSALPKDDVNCVAPVTTLPNTGAGNVIAVGVVALVGGFLWYRHMLFRRHKAAFIAADMDRAPLPLGEPMDSSTPLAGTPVDPAASHGRKTFRRRRRF